MDEEHCKSCSHFYVFLATLASPDKQFTPTCTITGNFVPISEIENCTMYKKKRTLLEEMENMEKYREPMTFIHEEEWEYCCLDCGGKGYEEKLSCGGTGYRMRRTCKTCKGKGTIKIEIKVGEV